MADTTEITTETTEVVTETTVAVAEAPVPEDESINAHIPADPATNTGTPFPGDANGDGMVDVDSIPLTGLPDHIDPCSPDGKSTFYHAQPCKPENVPFVEWCASVDPAAFGLTEVCAFWTAKAELAAANAATVETTVSVAPRTFTPATASTGQQLPTTGAGVGIILALGAVLSLVGLGAKRVSRRPA